MNILGQSHSPGAKLKSTLRLGHPATSQRATLRLETKLDGHQLITEAKLPGRTARAASSMPLGQIELLHEVKTWNAARRTGVALFQSVIAGDVLAFYREVESSGNCRVELAVDGDTLGQLPWELMRDPDREVFLAIDRQMTLTRTEGDGLSRSQTQPSSTNLRVQVQAESLDEAQVQFIDALGRDKSVDILVEDQLMTGERGPHVFQTTQPGAANRENSNAAPILVVTSESPPAAEARASHAAVLWLPAAMAQSTQSTFLSSTYSSLARALPIDVAVNAARRDVVDRHGIVDLEWSRPRLIIRDVPAPVVAPVSRPKISSAVKDHTASWLKDTAIGIVVAVLFLVASLALFRFGLSSSGSFELDLLSPWELFTTFKGIVLALSTRDEQLLLIVSGIGLTATLTVLAGSSRFKRTQTETFPQRVIGFGFSTRTVAFLAVATVAIAGAYTYQQYLWRVALPIRDEALGIAVTREVAAASIDAEVTDSLFRQGFNQSIVVRELPVAFDATNIDTARALGGRIGAKAVIVYRPETHEGQTTYAADVIFADPTIGLEVGTHAAGISPRDPAKATPQVQVREGLAIPALRSGTLTQLVNAAAGVIAYQESRYRDSIELLRLALAGDQSSSDTGIINFYLGNAYRLDGQDALALGALDQAIAFYEEQSNVAPLSPQDQLARAKSYEVKGWVARGQGDWELAIAVYLKADTLREPLISVQNQLSRPAEVHATFARIYTDLTDTYRFLGDSESENLWRQRALSEIDALASLRGLDSKIDIEEGVARFMIGDCIGSVAAFQRGAAADPTNAKPLHDSAIVAERQNDTASVLTLLNQVIVLKPNDVSSRHLLAGVLFSEAIHPGAGFVDTSYFDQAEQVYREILEIDPSNLLAHQQLADIESFRASMETTDVGALLFDDQAYQKSTFFWSANPDRRKRALEHLEHEIEQRRVIALELLPGDPDAQIELIDAYWSRNDLLYSANLDAAILGTSTPDLGAGEQILRDAAVISDWTTRLLARGDELTRGQRLAVWSYRVRALGNEWGWYSFFLNDAEKANDYATQFEEETMAAIAEVEAAPPATVDEVEAMQQIYLQASFVATALQNDPDTAQVYRTKSLQTAQSSFDTRSKDITHFDTICADVREQTAGDDRFRESDFAGALNHYRAALAINGKSPEAYLGLASTLFVLGKTDQAIEYATKATDLPSVRANAWSDLGLYQLAAADQEASIDAYTQFLSRLEGLPVVTQLELLDHAATRLASLSAATVQSAYVGEPVFLLASFLASIEPPPIAVYEYARIYQNLGEAVLMRGDFVLAESLLQRSIEIDSHRPKVLTLLSLAIIAQDKAATNVINQTAAEIVDMNWANGFLVTTDDVRAESQSAIGAFVERFPDQAGKVDPLVNAIELAGS